MASKMDQAFDAARLLVKAHPAIRERLYAATREEATADGVWRVVTRFQMEVARDGDSTRQQDGETRQGAQ